MWEKQICLLPGQEGMNAIYGEWYGDILRLSECPNIKERRRQRVLLWVGAQSHRYGRLNQRRVKCNPTSRLPNVRDMHGSFERIAEADNSKKVPKNVELETNLALMSFGTFSLILDTTRFAVSPPVGFHKCQRTRWRVSWTLPIFLLMVYAWYLILQTQTPPNEKLDDHSGINKPALCTAPWNTPNNVWNRI